MTVYDTPAQAAPDGASDATTDIAVCSRCGHTNEHARMSRTLFRRRLVVECRHMEESVSGMAGAEVCLCRAPEHRAPTSHERIDA